jgi:hypothetical protein
MTQTYTPPPPATSATFGSVRRALVAVWAVLTLGAGAFVAVIGTNAPYADEWEFVPALLGEEPALPWLWQQHNEHRLPLPRAAYLLLFKLTHDFRAGMLAQVAALSALALYLMRLADRLRGKPVWADAFFPISLLHVGHWENLVMGYQICFVLFCVLATGLGVVALRTTRENAFRSGVLAGLLLLALALTGGSGLVVVPPVAAWLVYLAVGLWRTGARGKAALVLLFVALPAAYLGAYFTDYHRPPDHPEPSSDPVMVARVALQVVAVSFGIGVSEVWWAAALGLLGVGGATAAVLLGRWGDPRERPAAAGLLAVAAGVTGVALAIGVGRGWGATMGLWSRYSLLAWPLLATTYLVWARLGGKWVPVALCVAAALAFPANTGTGMMVGAAVKGEYSAVAADAAAGLPAEQIADAEEQRHRRSPATVHVVLQRERAIRAIPMLRAARVGLFAREPAMSDVGLWWWIGGGAALVVLAALLARWLWVLGHAVHVERCRELFRLQHERFEEQLLRAAAATGLPRGLKWVACRITGDAVLVRDAATGGIVALVPVQIDFVPVEGSDMEDLPAAREPRPATAVFTFHGGAWHTAGRVVFNHTPDQTVAAFPELQRLPDHG